jgi:hypothetical protein
MVVDFHHAKEIPVELYLSHIHRKTGAYIAYPGIGFLGDQLYPEVHAQQLENTLFWPAISEDVVSQTSLALLNPYKVSFAYQVSLFEQGLLIAQTDTMRLPPLRVVRHFTADLFPEIVLTNRQISLCVAAQYKLVAYVIISNRDSGIISTIDHLHAYCLY